MYSDDENTSTLSSGLSQQPGSSVQSISKINKRKILESKATRGKGRPAKLIKMI
jgi:hypothetical protein